MAGTSRTSHELVEKRQHRFRQAGRALFSSRRRYGLNADSNAAKDAPLLPRSARPLSLGSVTWGRYLGHRALDRPAELGMICLINQKPLIAYVLEPPYRQPDGRT